MTRELSSPELVDVHAHLCDSGFDKDRSEVLDRARRAGIKAVIAVGEDISDARKNMDLAKKHTMVKPCAGLYPAYTDPDQAAEMVEFIRNNRKQLVAIGEVGLDYWVVQEEADREVQREIFEMFIELSKALQLPLNIHSRSAGRHVIALLLEHNACRVHLHAFDGKASTAFPAVEAGYFFSIPPSIVRSRQKQKLVKQLPLSSLLVESDSPVLGPVPSERNEPASILIVVKAIAKIKQVSEKEVLEVALGNTERLYEGLL